MIRAAALSLLLAFPAQAQNAEWAGAYGGLGLTLDRSGAELFVGAMAERGPALVGLELDAGLAEEESQVALTGRLGAGMGGTLLYGLAGLGYGGEGDGEAGLVLGAGAERRLGGLRLGGEWRQEWLGESAEGETRLGGRVALEF